MSDKYSGSAGAVLHHQDSDAEAAGSTRSAKRQKVTRACDNCKSRKRRCTGELPCTACHASGSQCTYLASYTRGRLVQPAPSVYAGDPASFSQEHNGLNRPDIESNGTDYLPPGGRAASPEEGSNYGGQYLGPTSPYTFLRRAWKRFEEDGTQSAPAPGVPDEQSQSQSIWAYGDRLVARVDDSEVVRLPKRSVTAHLFAQYFDFAMPTYRFVHKASVGQWLATYHQLEDLDPDRITLPPARRAIVLILLAISRLLDHEEGQISLEPNEEAWKDADQMYGAAMRVLETERGKARLESVQARLLCALYLQQTSRPNQSWYQFGTTAQLMMAMGLHRAASGTAAQQDSINRECRKRTFWSASTLDTYLSVVLGRPPLIHLEDVDQKLPEPIDDEFLNSAGIVPNRASKDSIIQASIFHSSLMRIVKKAAREQYSVQRKPARYQIETAARLNAETAEWHASLPIVLSGAVHLSSLIPILRRQSTVLQLAHTHALMLINRPCLLLESAHVTPAVQPNIDTCLTAAKTAIDAIFVAAQGKQIFPSFWLTKYTTFVALSVIYVWLIQRKHGHFRELEGPYPDDELLQLAEQAQSLLAQVTQVNAPSLRYNIVLEELRQEIHRLTDVAVKPPPSASHVARPPHLAGLVEATAGVVGKDGLIGGGGGVVGGEPLVADNSTPYAVMDLFSNEFPLDPDLWLQLDSFPFSDFGQTG